ncbi:MAG: signal peptidase II [Eubacteriales bacterium]|nr:signal peptidase II [Eubacteriales bacterium]
MILAAVIAVDQLVKIAVRANMMPGDTISVIGSFFKLAYVRNPGAAFGMFADNKAFLIGVPAAIMAAALIFILKSRYTNKLAKYALIMIIGGGFSNLIDRVIFGSVTDMFSFSIFPPVFNVADIAVCAGCALLVVYILFGEKITESGRFRR